MATEHAPGRSYIRAAVGSEPISEETTRYLAKLVGIEVPDEDIALLAAALSSQLAGIAALDELDLADVNPAIEFDPRWS